MGKRIWQYPEATGITNDDVILLDSPTGGSRSIKANKIGSVLINKTFTERGTFDAAEDNADGYKKVTVDVPYTDVLVASGPIASWDDGEDLPLKSLTANITPQQDLHGYDSPWVGGAGKNKLPMTVDDIKAVNTYHSWSGNSTTINNVTITIETDNVGNVTGIRFNGTASADITFNLATNISIPNGSYKWSNDQIVNISNLWLSLTSPNVAITLSTQKEVNVTVSNDSIGNAYIYASSGNAFNNVIFKPMIRLASVSDSTFAPYSNICPISGWAEANVTVSPLNINPLYNGQIYGDGTWVENSARLTNAQTAQSNVYFLKAGTYTLDYDKLNSNAPSLLECSLLTKDDNYTIIDNFANAWNILPFTFTLTQDGYLYFTVRKDPTTTLNADDYKIKILGQSYTIDLGGTRYGGTLDVVNGVLTITDGYIASYNGETLPSTWISDRDVYAEGRTPTVGAEVVYKLASPQTYQLTPQQIKSLVGKNNIYSDTGDVDVEYQKIWVRPSA